ncbi:MAG: substrate-binding periplasmic protein [Anaerolineae bacterium]
MPEPTNPSQNPMKAIAYCVLRTAYYLFRNPRSAIRGRASPLLNGAGFADPAVGGRRSAVIFLIGLVAIAMALLSLRGVIGRQRDETWARIQRSGMMRVGLDPSFPPFEVDNGIEIVGYDVDLARALAERWGVAVQFVPISFDGLIDGLLAEQYDVIISAYPYDPRLTQDVAYSKPYFNAGQVLVVRADDSTIASIQDLAGRRLAVEWGSGGDVEARRLVKRISDLEIVLFETPTAALDGLRAGQADGALVDAVSALGYIGQQGGVRVVGEPLTDERYIIVARSDSRQLLKEIDAALVDFHQAGLFQQLRARWF